MRVLSEAYIMINENQEHGLPCTPSGECEPNAKEPKIVNVGGTEYDLGHLRPFTVVYDYPATGKKPAASFSVNVSFSHHCYSSGLPRKSETFDSKLLFEVNGDKRLFDLRRWKLSKHLPAIITKLSSRKCEQSGRGNFFTVAIIEEDGSTVEYEVFFRVWKPGRGRLFIHIESAYVRDGDYKSSRPASTAISFFVILDNTRRERPIHGDPFAR